MTPIRNSMSMTSSDPPEADQTSNGIHPVSTSPRAYGYRQVLDDMYNSGLKLSLLLMDGV